MILKESLRGDFKENKTEGRTRIISLHQERMRGKSTLLATNKSPKILKKDNHQKQMLPIRHKKKSKKLVDPKKRRIKNRKNKRKEKKMTNLAQILVKRKKAKKVKKAKKSKNLAPMKWIKILIKILKLIVNKMMVKRILLSCRVYLIIKILRIVTLYQKDKIQTIAMI